MAKMNQMNTIKLVSGKLVINEPVFILGETISTKSDYVGWVYDKKNKVPPCIFFSEKPVRDFTDKENACIFSMYERMFPVCKRIRQKEVHFKQVDNNPVNGDAWAASSHLFIMPVWELGELGHSSHPAEIIREE